MTKEDVEEIFRPLAEGRPDAFFEHVASDVEWHVLGTHPLAGVYYSKDEFRAATIDRLNNLFDQGLAIHFRDAIVEGDRAAVELYAKQVSRAGVRFDNEYCWICTFRDGKIVEVRAFLDSALVQEVVDVGEFRVRKHHHLAARELGRRGRHGMGRAIAHQ